VGAAVFMAQRMLRATSALTVWIASVEVVLTGSGVTAAAFAKAGTVPMIDLGNVASPYTGLLGLNTSVHFIGALAGTPAIPEPATYALMGLGLVGVAAVARRRAA